MSFLDKVLKCNTRNVKRYLPFLIEKRQYGYITPERAALLGGFPDVFDVTIRDVSISAKLTTPESRTKAIDAIAKDLVATGAFALKGEYYAVKNGWHAPEAMRLDRSMVPGFGTRAYGVHINGFIRKADGIHLWIGTRSNTVRVEPGKLDNMVAGGQQAGMTLMDNVVKECSEEASLPEALARTAKPVSNLSYCFDAPEGLKVDNLFCFDLEMPADVIPKNADGEFAGYQLLPIAEVLDGVRNTTSYKFNVNLVILDFAIRHGLIAPDTEPDYERIVRGIHEAP